MGGGLGVSDETDDEDDGGVDEANFIPVSLPPHLQVMNPPTDVNLNIVQGPSGSQGSGASNTSYNGIK